MRNLEPWSGLVRTSAHIFVRETILKCEFTGMMMMTDVKIFGFDVFRAFRAGDVAILSQ